MQKPWIVLVLAIIAVVALSFAPSLAQGSEESSESSQFAGSSVLEETYLFTLTLDEGGTSYDFSMAVASRQFSFSLGEKDIRLRGRLSRQKSGRELLDYTLEYSRVFGEEAGGKQRRGSTWNGGVYLGAGEPVEIVRFLGGSFRIEMAAMK